MNFLRQFEFHLKKIFQSLQLVIFKWKFVRHIQRCWKYLKHKSGSIPIIFWISSDFYGKRSTWTLLHIFTQILVAEEKMAIIVWWSSFGRKELYDRSAVIFWPSEREKARPGTFQSRSSIFTSRWLNYENVGSQWEAQCFSPSLQCGSDATTKLFSSFFSIPKNEWMMGIFSISGNALFVSFVVLPGSHVTFCLATIRCRS